MKKRAPHQHKIVDIVLNLVVVVTFQIQSKVISK